MKFFLTKYIMFELKKSIGKFCLMALNIDATFDKKLTCSFKNDFHQGMFKSLKTETLMGFFYPKQKCMSLKFTGEFCVMTMRNDEKSEEELTCQFKIDMRNLMNFDPCTQKSQKFAL